MTMEQTVKAFQNAMKKLEQAGRLVHIAGTNMPEEVVSQLDEIEEKIEYLEHSLVSDEYEFDDEDEG